MGLDMRTNNVEDLKNIYEISMYLLEIELDKICPCYHLLSDCTYICIKTYYHLCILPNNNINFRIIFNFTTNTSNCIYV